MSEFQDQIIYITGAASGFGKLLAERMASEGAKLFLTDINSDQLSATAKGIGAQAKWQQSDVADKQNNQAAVKACVEQWGGLDMAVNNAGIVTPMRNFIDIEEEEYDLLNNVNAKGVFFGMQAQIKQMLSQKKPATILNVSSMAGLGGSPKIAAYGASKHAVVGLTKTAAVEYAKANIRVNAICPFFTPTPLIDQVDEQTKQFLASGAPMKRMAKPEEIVVVMESLLRPSNSYMTGQCIAVDGGVSAF